jgi:hypothetical protein
MALNTDRSPSGHSGERIDEGSLFTTRNKLIRLAVVNPLRLSLVHSYTGATTAHSVTDTVVQFLLLQKIWGGGHAATGTLVAS